MTRQEEIRNAAIDYAEIEDNFLEYDDCGDVCDDKIFVERSFEEGAKWADKNLNKKTTYTKQELRDMGFGFDLNGNIETPEECYKRAKKYTEYRKKKLIEKACEWLKKTMYIYTEYDTDVDWGITTPIDWVTSDCNTVDEFIDGFRKAMEE